MAARVALELKGIERHYGQGETVLSILKGADFVLKSGETVALVAPSGTGKSTLLHVAGLLEKPDAGEVFVGGLATTKLDDKGRTRLRRTEIGFVYQFHHLLPEFTALENIMMPQLIGGLSKGEARERAAQLLDYMRIGHRADHRPSELSGGEQQRVAIARAVANAPLVLLADEPTGNLDPETANRVLQVFAEEVRRSGAAVVLVTHSEVAAAAADRTLILGRDGLVERPRA